MATASISPQGNYNRAAGATNIFRVRWSNPSSVSGFDANDVTVTGATLTRVISNFMWITNPQGDGGEATITIRENAVTQGNDEYSYTFEWGSGVRAVITLALENVLPYPTGTAKLQIRANKNITGLALNDFTTVNGTLSNVQGSGNNWTADLTFPSTGSGTTQITLRENAVTQNNAAVSISRDYAPIVLTLTLPEEAIRGETVTATLTSPYDLSNITQSDFSASAGTLSNLRGSAKNWSIDLALPSTGSGMVTLTLGANSVTPPNAEATAKINYGDLTIAMTFAETRAYRGEKVTLTITSPRDITDFTESDLTANVGTLSNLTGSGKNWTVDLTLPTTGAGTATVTLTANSVVPFNREATASIAYDGIGVTIALPTTAYRGDTVTARITAPEDISSFTEADLSTDVGTLSNLRGSGRNWQVDLALPSTGTGEATATLTLRENSVLPYNKASSAKITFRSLDLTITLPETAYLGDTVTAVITSPRAFTGLTESDFSTTGGTLSNLRGSALRWELTLTLPNDDLTEITVTLSENAITPANVESTGAITPLPITITLSSTHTDARQGDSVRIDIQSNRDISEFDIQKISASGGGFLEDLQGSGRNYQMLLTLPETGSGTVRVVLLAEATLPLNAGTFIEISYREASTKVVALFQKERNRTTTPAAAGDNDYGTWTTQRTVTCEISDEDGNATNFDHIFVICSGVISYRLIVDGVLRGTRTLPESLQISNAEPPIPDVSITRNGWQHDLFERSEILTGRRVVLEFTGSNIRINEVLILKRSIILNENFLSISHSKVDIDSVLQKSDDGREERELIVGRDRLRWMSECALEFVGDDANYEVFLDWIEDNPNCVVAQDTELYPWRLYKAVFMELQHNAPYICHVLEAGNVVNFRLLENRVISSVALPLIKTFNTEDSQQKYLFFNDCVHLDNDRVRKATGSIDYDACDNDFATYSSETTLIFDISDGADPTRVTHVWLKGTGITGYQIQTRVGNAWITQQTLTPIHHRYRGWENSLGKLTTPISATQVRLVFVGSSIKISEVMLLEHAGGLVSMSNILPIKTDRTGIVQQTQAGTVERAKTEPSSRFKWQLDFSAVFGHNNTHKLEDFLDWINSNPNHTFAERPEDQPWRVYPAGFLNSGFNASYITQTIQIGEMVQCQLSER